jgi:hypothetical protein
MHMIVTKQGKMDFACIAVDAPGNVLGQAIVDSRAPSPATAHNYRAGAETEDDVGDRKGFIPRRKGCDSGSAQAQKSCPKAAFGAC